LLFGLLAEYHVQAAEQGARLPERGVPRVRAERLDQSYLKGHVFKSAPPFLTGLVHTAPEGTTVELTLVANLNSEVNQKGDEVFARVSTSMVDGKRLLLPAGWYLHGLVTGVSRQKRLGRDGWIEIEFDKLVSPDGSWELPFPVSLSTKDNKLKSVAKTVATDLYHVGQGAIGGAILSAQLTGIPLAIMTHGYSLAAGAAVGGAAGAVGALKRKGQIASFYPGDQIKVSLDEPIALPEFKKEAETGPIVLSDSPADIAVAIEKATFQKDPFGDRAAQLLTIDITVDNRTSRQLSFFDLAVVSDHNMLYLPSITTDMRFWRSKFPPGTSRQATVSFSVDRPDDHYFLVLLNESKDRAIARIPIN